MEANEPAINSCKISKLENGIIKCEFVKDFHYSTQLAWQIFDICNNQAGDARYKMIWIMRTRLQPQKELFDFYANPQRAEKIEAEAFCIGSTAVKMMANFYFRAKKPIIPSRVFEVEEEAIKWLLSN